MTAKTNLKSDKHEKLVEAAKKAINDIFSDTSVTRSQTRESLYDLHEKIDTDLSALEDDC